MQNLYKKNISNLWNDKWYVNKYLKTKYAKKSKERSRMIERQEMVVKYLKNSNLGRNIKILELGYGAGQGAKDFMSLCNKFYGIDISRKLSSFAKKNNSRAVKSGKAKFLVGSLEKKFKIKSNSIDVIIGIGIFQYIINLNNCFRECRRVLKKNGFIIIAQPNTLEINNLVYPRKFFINLLKFFLKEPFMLSYSTTLKSLFQETKLKKYYKKYKKSWLMNSWIFTSGSHSPWNFKGKRRLLSYTRLKKIITDNDFSIIHSCGLPFFYNNRNNLSEIIFGSLNIFLKFLNQYTFFSLFLKYVGSISIFFCRKNN